MSTNIALQPADFKMRPIPQAPEAFDGLRFDYIAQWLETVLPDEIEVNRLHRIIVQYVKNRCETLLVRQVSGMERGPIFRTQAGSVLKFTDNAPAWWWHSVLF